jgi:hypothetical protein
MNTKKGILNNHTSPKVSHRNLIFDDDPEVKNTRAK